MSNTGELDTWFDPQTLGVLQTRRLSQGKNSRLKTHRFLDNGVWRERLEPADADQARDETKWTSRSAALIPYPAHADAGAPVLTPVMLVARAAELVRAGRKASDQLVFTDTQLYHVRLATAPPDSIDISFRLVVDGKERRVREMRQAQRVAVMPRLLGTAAEKEAFSLLELTGRPRDFHRYRERTAAAHPGHLAARGHGPRGPGARRTRARLRRLSAVGRAPRGYTRSHHARNNARHSPRIPGRIGRRAAPRRHHQPAQRPQPPPAGRGAPAAGKLRPRAPHRHRGQRRDIRAHWQRSPTRVSASSASTAATAAWRTC